MDEIALEHDVTLGTIDDIPTRMFYASRRWRITDTPTRLRDAVWSGPLQGGRSLYGWRFQATDDDGVSFVFDVFRTENDWHVHRAYS